MIKSDTLGDLLTTLLERRPFGRKLDADRIDIADDCLSLLSASADNSELQLTNKILSQYWMLDHDQKLDFFQFLNRELDLNADLIGELAEAHKAEATPQTYKALAQATTPLRLTLFRRLNQAPDATGELVKIRKDLRKLLKEHPDLEPVDHDLLHLFRSWFNRGFLVIRQITWDSPASILEKIIEYEAVHTIHTWEDLRRRIEPTDRRCFAFFHPAMPSEPLIFVEVALTKRVPKSIDTVLSDSHETIPDTEADTAVFYSISNCQDGLAGVSFGNSLIKQVVRDLANELPNLKKFVTLSPIPGFNRWLSKQGIGIGELESEELRSLAAVYIVNAKTRDGLPLDPVTRFHIGNGAIVHAVHSEADLSENGLAQSHGHMVNYMYDLDKIATNVADFTEKKDVKTTKEVATLIKGSVNLHKSNVSA